MNFPKSSFLTVLLLGASALASGAQAAGPYDKSFKNLLLSPTENGLNRRESGACLSALKAFYAKGSVLHSELIEEHLTTEPSLTFFHYTPANKMKKIVRGNRVREIFDHLRDPQRDAKAWDVLFYVANDRFSSADYGHLLIEVTTRPNVVLLREPVLKRLLLEKGFGDLVVREVTDASVDLKACDGSPSLYYLTAEDMGVDLIHYDAFLSGGHWFQFLSPTSIDRLRLLK